jgi:tRNA-dihydrouridine synthase B
VRIPVIANGDIDSPRKARRVLEQTGADALMIGRAAQGRPWLFREIDHYLRTGQTLAPPSLREIHAVLRGHLLDLYAFHGEDRGVRIARKHIGWYTGTLRGARAFLAEMNQAQSAPEQMKIVDRYFERIDGADPQRSTEELAA